MSKTLYENLYDVWAELTEGAGISTLVNNPAFSEEMQTKLEDILENLIAIQTTYYPIVEEPADIDEVAEAGETDEDNTESENNVVFDVEEILKRILKNIISTYTGITSADGAYKFSPTFGDTVFFLPNGPRGFHAWIEISGDRDIDSEHAWRFINATTGIFDFADNNEDKVIGEEFEENLESTDVNETNEETDSIIISVLDPEIMNKYKLHYSFMGYMNSDSNPHGEPHLGEVRFEKFGEEVVFSCKDWQTGHWLPNKAALVHLVPKEIYNIVHNIFGIIDQFTEGEHSFSSYFTSCHQYSCVNRYLGLTNASDRNSYDFNNAENYALAIRDIGTEYGNPNESFYSFQPYSVQELPVGFVYISCNNENPENILGYGAWESFSKVQTLVGVSLSDTGYEEPLTVGGEKVHTLSISEMPVHTHNYTKYSTNNGNPDAASYTGGSYYFWKGNTQNNVSTTSLTSGTAHNNLAPYIAVYMFIRVE